ncbi:MAG: hypothetical protein FWD69_09150 [Polyangiaceae bacterium]|nr:hypothetical protein [Polyangiaceae bacterium]
MSGGRIRSIKPEILEDAVTAGLSDVAFRIFIAVIVLADDYGRFRAEPGWLRGQIYWSKDVDLSVFAAALKELDPLVRLYQVNARERGGTSGRRVGRDSARGHRRHRHRTDRAASQGRHRHCVGR